MATKISVTATDANDNKINKTLPDVNPSADDAKLKTWAQGLNALTTNTQVGITKVVTTDLLNGGGDTSTKLPRNLTVKETSGTPSTAATIAISDLKTTPGDPAAKEFQVRIGNGGDFAAVRSLLININQPWSAADTMPTVGANIYYYSLTEEQGGIGMAMEIFKSVASQAETVAGTVITITIPETATYAEESVTITLE